MSIITYCKSFYFSHLSRPRRERCLYRAIAWRQVTSIVEVGLGLADRALRMIQVASFHARHGVRYTGIDEFESRGGDAGPGLTLKHAFQRLRTTDATIQLVPGDPYTALARMANSLSRTDLVLISADVDVESLRKAWFYVPRMLHPRSLVYLQELAEDGSSLRYVQLAIGEVNRLAEKCQVPQRRAAA